MRRVVLLAAAGALAAMVAAPSADAVSFGQGTARLNIKNTFAAKLRAAGARMRGTNGAISSGRGTTFQVDSGVGTLTPPFTEDIELSGRWKIDRRRGRDRTFRNLEHEQRGDRGRFKTGRVSLFTENTRNRTTVDPGFTALDTRAAGLRLTRLGARIFNRALPGSPFRRGMAVGTLSVHADRSVVFTGGEIRVQLNDETAGRLAACGVQVTPIEPARPEPPGPGHAAPKFVFPIDTGAPASLRSILARPPFAGLIRTAGGVRLRKPSTGRESTLTQLTSQVDGDGGQLRALTSDAGEQQLGILDLTNARADVNLTADNGSLVLHNVPIALSPGARLLLQANYQCSLPEGSILGTIEDAGGPVQ